MNDQPVRLSTPPKGYTDWLTDLKARIHSAQQRAFAKAWPDAEIVQHGVG